MARSLVNVIIDRVVSAVRVKLTDAGEGNVATVGADGRLSVNSSDTSASGYTPVRLSDGSNFYSFSGPFSGSALSTFSSGFPVKGLAAGFYGAGSMREARVFDSDTGAGSEWLLGVNLRKSAGGGSVELGTASSPVRVDPTGSTTQPVRFSAAASGCALETGGNLDGIRANSNRLDADLSSRLSESGFASRVGEAQASPGQYTALGRLKTMETALGDLLARCNLLAEEATMGSAKLIEEGIRGAAANLLAELQSLNGKVSSAALGGNQVVRAQIVDAAGVQVTQFGANPVGINDLKPDGTHQQPSMDSASRPGYTLSLLPGRNKSWRSAVFSGGASPATIDVNAALSRNGRDGFIECLGPGNIKVEISDDGTNYGDAIYLRSGVVHLLYGWDVDTVKVTHDGTNSGYQVVAR